MRRPASNRCRIVRFLPGAILVVVLPILLGVLLAPATLAQPVIVTISTDTGNDTLQEGSEGSIRVNVDANGVELGGIQMFLRFAFSSGNVIGPISDSTNFSFSPAAAVLELQVFDNTYGNGTDPDSILFAAVDLFPPLWTGSAEFARVTFTPSHAGEIYIDSAVVAGGSMMAVDAIGFPVPIVWQADTIHVQSLCPLNGDVNCDGAISAADLVYLVNHVFKSGPPPCD